VAQRGSLSAAAREEGITPAMVGRRIDQLEERLAVKLFKRSTRKVTLTPEGRPSTRIVTASSRSCAAPRTR
jgi:DNA-binding transcriptional LysR family regulator